jgi:hypothetical protein
MVSWLPAHSIPSACNVQPIACTGAHVDTEHVQGSMQRGEGLEPRVLPTSYLCPFLTHHNSTSIDPTVAIYTAEAIDLFSDARDAVDVEGFLLNQQTPCTPVKRERRSSTHALDSRADTTDRRLFTVLLEARKTVEEEHEKLRAAIHGLSKVIEDAEGDNTRPASAATSRTTGFDQHMPSNTYATVQAARLSFALLTRSLQSVQS